ncbi:MAG: methyltransferase domain-containing protein [Candidatus Marinimicrobia bacterium]|jgi:ubiquinone/menaquinone biosynthesis C-methylase UbiE|nr:methyltransferase domain-containing protein [Candidatus Neomarinimicrobiota bacterium]MDP6726862.1 methyltransferase domain-containing protein [Candidatus Neomarinimicrobiota bacterium]|tara:strand:+ start:2524 stop:3180 length:657 start_codon:yes stop_codon:yes gene_type:complete
MKKILLFLLLTTLFPAQEHDYKHQSNKHSFSDAERWAKIFENPDRDEWQQPDLVIQSMNIEPNDIIVDIGSATGYFPVRFAKVVHQGNVVGVDVEKDMVDYLNHRAQEESIHNLKSILGEFHDPKIPLPVDIVFICNTYHHIEDRVEYFKNIKRKFKQDGKLVIVDFRKGDLPVGPPDEHKLSPEDVIMELGKAGYLLTDHQKDLPYQYMLTFILGDT